MTDSAMPRPLMSWRLLLVCWGVLALVPVAPSFQDGVLSNLSPVGFGYFGLVLAPTRVPPLAFLVLGLHLAASFALMVAVGVARRRLGTKRFKVAMIGTAVVSVLAVSLLVRTCWPDGIFFDASNISYDVSDLVQAPTRPGARFTNAEAVASSVLKRTAGYRKHYVPCRITAFSNEPTIVAWGTWPEHYHFRQELESLRRE